MKALAKTVDVHEVEKVLKVIHSFFHGGGANLFKFLRRKERQEIYQF
jgi:hypothetical protein